MAKRVNSEAGLPAGVKRFDEKPKWMKLTACSDAPRWSKTLTVNGVKHWFKSKNTGHDRQGHDEAWEQFKEFKKRKEEESRSQPTPPKQWAAEYDAAIEFRRKISQACMEWVSREKDDPQWRHRNDLTTRLKESAFHLKYPNFLPKRPAESGRSKTAEVAPDQTEEVFSFRQLPLAPTSADALIALLSENERRLSHYSDLYAQMIGEIDQLNEWRRKPRPKQLDELNSLPVIPSALDATGNVELDRWHLELITEFEIRLQWTKPLDAKSSTAHHIERYLASIRTNAGREKDGTRKQITAARFNNVAFHLSAFSKFTGDTAAKSLSEAEFAAYHSALLKDVDAGRFTRRTAADRLNEAKMFLRWLESENILQFLPRNMQRLKITVPPSVPASLSDEQVASAIAAATERTRLFVLLMLNTGATQVDLSDLKHSEVDFERGVITRKRSKTSHVDTVPVVQYILWDETLTLLKRHASNPRSGRVLLTDEGKPLVVKDFVTSRKHGTEVVSNNDAVRGTFRWLKKQLPFAISSKLLRKTSARKLKEHETYSRPDFEDLFLGHAPKSIAERNYSGGLNQQLFNEAVKWLGERWGFSTSER